MTKVMLYTRHNTTAWWRYIASRLSFASRTVMLSELRGEGDIWIMPEFYDSLRTQDTALVALDEFGEEVCAEIVQRCRLLRNLDRTLALKMVGAMWQTLDRIVETEAPDIFMSFMADSYVLDLLERALSRRGVRYLGLAGSILPGQVRFTARGEYIPLREPTDEEVERAVATITSPQFAPPYLLSRPRYDVLRFLRSYLYFRARGLAFEFMRRWDRDPLGYRYLTTWVHVADYRIRLRDWRIVRYISDNWRERLEAVPFERRVFIGLHLNPEASTDYRVKNLDLVKYEAVLECIVKILSDAGFAPFVKDHPNMFGFRQVELFERLSKFKNVTFVPYGIPARFLIENCKATFTWTGTIGLQAALAGRCPIVAEGAYYICDGLFLVIRSLDDLEELPSKIVAFAPAVDLVTARRQLVRHVLGTCTPGEAWRNFLGKKPEGLERMTPLIESLNQYLPRFAHNPVTEVTDRC